jgi:Ca2+-binding EF-hand superfamily protein
MEKKGTDMEHNLRERLLTSRKNERTLALMINSFLEDNKDNVSADAHKIVRTRMEILQDKYANLLLKESEMRKKLATIEGVERTVNIKDKVIETMQEDSSDLQLELEILRSRLSLADPNYRRYEEVFGRFVEFVKTNSISLINFFKKFDTSGDGLLNKDEMASAFNALGFKATSEDVATIFSFFDLDGSGNINYREFLKKLRRSGITMRSKEEQGIYKLYKAIVDANFTLRKAFDAIDKDGSNTISKGEMESAMLKMGIPITADTVDFIFRMADNDMDDKVTYGEFEKVFESVVAKGEVEERALFETQLNWKYAVLLKIEECAVMNKMSVMEAFNLVDKDGTKRITIDELGAMFRKTGAEISRNNLVDLFQMVDRDGSKWIGYDEFLELIR